MWCTSWQAWGRGLPFRRWMAPSPTKEGRLTSSRHTAVSDGRPRHAAQLGKRTACMHMLDAHAAQAGSGKSPCGALAETRCILEESWQKMHRWTARVDPNGIPYAFHIG